MAKGKRKQVRGAHHRSSPSDAFAEHHALGHTPSMRRERGNEALRTDSTSRSTNQQSKANSVVDDSAENTSHVVRPAGLLVTGYEPRAGIRMWLRVQRVTEATIEGSLMCAIHWVAPSQTRMGWLARMAALPPDYRQGWCSAPVDVATNLIAPQPSVVSAQECEVFETDLYYRPSTGDVLQWTGFRVVIRSRTALHRFPLDRQQMTVSPESS